MCWPDRFPELETERLRITIPEVSYAPQVRAYFEDNREHLEPWGPPMPPVLFTDDYWRERLADNRDAFERGEKLSLSLRLRGALPQVGTVTVFDFLRGPAQRCTLGYNLAAAHVGQGLMTEALGAVLPYVFETTGIHRICASHVVGNERSAAVLRRLGFEVDGTARGWMYGAHGWSDSVLYGLLAPNAPAPW
ncbi:MAG: GNAT family N-acetyltransferase [Sandaracinus sp.]|nr:GNAT family N-acetyltransferase [Sandaracinus sp.]